MHRPVGATILSILAFLRGLLAIFLFMLLFSYGSITFFLGNHDRGAVSIYFAVPYLITGIVTLILSVGLWRLRPWAWMWTVIILVIGLLIELVIVYFGGNLLTLDLIYSVIILIYMLQGSVRTIYLENPASSVH